MQGRFYLPQYGRFTSPDPGKDQNPGNPQSWNIYSYTRNNPVAMFDPTGLAAWNATRAWNAREVAFYHHYLARVSQQFRAETTALTCEDLQIKILVDFASQKGLPVKLNIDGKVFDSRAAEFQTPTQFSVDLMHAAGAKDLIPNTHRVSDAPKGDLAQLKDAKAGDLMFFQFTDGRVHHVADIGSIGNGFLRFFEGSQGVGTRAPLDLFYGGRDMRSGTLNTNTGDMQRDGGEFQAGRFQFKQTDVRDWNFMSWNAP